MSGAMSAPPSGLVAALIQEKTAANAGNSEKAVEQAAQIGVRPGGRDGLRDVCVFRTLHQFSRSGILHPIAADEQAVGIDSEGRTGDKSAVIVLPFDHEM